MKQSFLNKYKVFLIGLLMAITTTGIEIYNQGAGHASPWIIGWSLFIAALSYIGRNIRGQLASIVGIVLTTVLAFYNIHSTPEGVNWSIILKDLIMPMITALISVLWTSPAKSRGYEQTDLIKEAKQEGEIRVPTMAKPKP